MSVYLKKFETHNEYETYIASEGKILPNVSFCKDDMDVHFNPTPPETRVVAIYIPEKVGAEVKLFGLDYPYVEPPFSMMEVNGVLQEGMPMTLSVPGETEYVVKYTFKEGESQLVERLFWDCPRLTSVTIPNGVTSIGEKAFDGCSRLTSITIPNSVTSIGERAFIDCYSLTSVTIPNSVTSIGSYAFSSCSELSSITIPNSVTNIEEDTFGSCSSLTSVTIGNSVASIGRYAFYNCSGLTSVTIPNSVTNIGERAFYDCSNLESITVEATEPPILDTSDVFDYTNDCPIYVPSESVEIYKGESMWDEYVDRIQAIP